MFTPYWINEFSKAELPKAGPATASVDEPEMGRLSGPMVSPLIFVSSIALHCQLVDVHQPDHTFLFDDPLSSSHQSTPRAKSLRISDEGTEGDGLLEDEADGAVTTASQVGVNPDHRKHIPLSRIPVFLLELISVQLKIFLKRLMKTP